MSINRRIFSLAFFLSSFLFSKSQDTIVKMDSNIISAKIIRVTDEVVDFAPYDFQDGPTHEIKRSKVAWIKWESGKYQSISGVAPGTNAADKTPVTTTATTPANPVSTNNTNSKPATTTVTTTSTTANTTTNAPPAKTKAPEKPTDVNTDVPCAAFDPTAKLDMDATIQLCGFKSSTDVHYKGQKANNFYVNDPDKKFLNGKQLTCVGLDFGWMKLISDRDLDKAADLKQKDLPHLCGFMNDAPTDYFLQDKFGKGKKVKVKMDKMKASWKGVNEEHWVCTDDYKLEPGKIPAIIRASVYDQKDGLGAVFIVEKFSKPMKTVSGYWVIFDFADRKVLLIDHLVYSDVTQQLGETAFWAFWKDALNDAYVWHPFDIEKYCELEKKNQFEKVCGN